MIFLFLVLVFGHFIDHLCVIAGGFAQ